MRLTITLILTVLFSEGALTARTGMPLQQAPADSVKRDTTKIKLIYLPVILLKDSTLRFNLEYSGEEKSPSLFPRITLPDNPLEIDPRGSSYYTPREVQDQLDMAMNRPRSESYVPVFALAAFAARLVEKQLNIRKLLERKAEDYLISESGWQLLMALWRKAPMDVKEIYRIHHSYSAGALEKELLFLNEKGLLKTRKTENGVILFYPAQKAQKVLALFNAALPRVDSDPETLRLVLKRKKELEDILLP